MKKLKYIVHYLTIGLFLTSLFIAGVSRLTAQENATEEESFYELSPFEVSASENVGYLATASLAGTRINTDLRDLGAAISVVTREFLDDTGVTGIDELLVYTTGTEVGGAFGNFTNSNTANGGRPLQQSNRADPEGNTRIRGLVSAELSRDFFITDFGFDTFNVERVDISRGPNSILFGVGSPGGVIDYSMKRPLLGAGRNEVSVRIGQRGTHRETGDFNVVLIEDRLAIRINLLNETTNYRQEPAYEDDQRIFGAIEGILFENRQSNFLGATRIKANFETAEVKATPPNVVAPTDNVIDWYQVPNFAAITAQTGASAPSRYTDGSFVSQALHDQFGTGAPFKGSLAQNLPWFISIGQIYSDPTDGKASLVGFPDSVNADLQAIEARIAGSFDWRMQTNLVEETWTTGFTARTFQNTDIYDFQNQLITGTLESRQDDFENVTIALEQLFLENKAGLEFSYNRQSLERRTEFPFSNFRSYDVWMDNNLWFGNGEPNPNVGRPFMVSRAWGEYSQSKTERDTVRATGFYEFDFEETFDGSWAGWLGRHVFSGIVERSKRDILSRSFGMATSSDEADMRVVLNANLDGARSQHHAGFYVGPDLRGVSSYDAVRLSGVIDVPVAKNGDRFRTFIYDPVDKQTKNITAYPEEYLQSGSARARVIDSEAISMQSYFFDGYLVGLLGYRTDSVQDTINVGGPRLPSGALDPASLLLNDEPSLDASGNTVTKSLVAHFPEAYLFDLPAESDLSVFYNESENFQPTGFRQNVFLETIAPPTGSTREYGFQFSFLDNKYSLRTNWYETLNKNVSLRGSLASASVATVAQWATHLKEAQQIGVPFGFTVNGDESGLADYYDNYDQVIDVILNDLVPEPMASARNLRLADNGIGLSNIVSDSVEGLTSTSNFVAKGVEFEFVANPTTNWRIALNAAKQETVQSGSGLDLQLYYSELKQNVIDANLWDTDILDGPNVNGVITYKQRLTRDRLNPLAAITAQDGTVSKEQRKWRWNMVTNYQFQDGGFLKGFEVGGAVRWQDKAAVGYPIILVESEGDILQQPNLSNPFFTPSTWNGDLFVRYKRQLTNRIHWTAQLNLRNVFGDQDLTPEVINPDGSNAVIRIPVERAFFLTNTFSF